MSSQMNYILKVVGEKGSARVYRNSEWEEFVVILRDPFDNLVPNAHYHTSDKDVAIGTAEFMVH